MAKHIVILGGNDTSYQLQQGLLARTSDCQVSLVHDANYIYSPSSYYPELLVGTLNVKDAGLANNRFFSSKVNYLRFPPAPHIDTVFVNTVTDAHNISILHLPAGRRRYFTLHNTDNVIMAGAELAQYGSLVVYGSSARAIQYATAAATAGYKAWLVPEKRTLINAHFDQTANKLIHELIAQAKVSVISLAESELLMNKVPALYTPYAYINPGLMRIRQQLNNHYSHYPSTEYQLQDGGDWYQLPVQISEQMINRLLPEETPTNRFLSYLWGNKPALPHRVEINQYALHYAGQLQADKPEECITMSVPEHSIYRKIILAGNRIAGFLLAGDVRGSDRLADMMLTHHDILPVKDKLIFMGR